MILFPVLINQAVRYRLHPGFDGFPGLRIRRMDLDRLYEVIQCAEV